MIDPGALGTRSEPRTVSWTARDTMLYALAVGAGTDDLALTTDNSTGVEQKVLPSFAVVPATSAKLVKALGEIKLSGLLHASQRVRLHRPLAPEGALEVEYEIADLVDKGEGRNAFVTIAGRGTDAESGELVAETAMSLMIRNGGGFGGPEGSSDRGPEIPEREPDAVVVDATRPDQALLYRLTGDRNPLHSDPAFAGKAGFERPILHGMATYGFATRALVAEIGGGDPDRVRLLDARLAAPVLPGDVLTTRMWAADTGHAVFRTSARTAGGNGADERVVLDRGRVEVA